MNGPHYLSGDQWTDATIRAWVAGFIDRGGNIGVRPKAGQLSMAVTSRDPASLHAMRDLLGVGDIEAHARIAGLHVWRLRDADDVRRVLTFAIDYLNTKAADARAALAQVDELKRVRAARAARDREILALHEAGTLTNTRIAEIVGTTPHIVVNVIARFRRENEITIHSRRK